MMYMDFKRKLPIPMETKEMYPLTGDMAETVERTVTELKAIFSGESDKLALIIGPCSADNEESVIDYISRLMPLREQVKDKILIVPRIYTNKPRTTGDGYKGLVHQPDPNAQPDLFKGIIATRELHMRAVKETGFVCADEMLYPENHKYLDDLLGYVAVGARSVEDRGWEGHSYGNPFAHAILRGYVNRQGVTHPNYHYEDLLYLSDLYKKWELKNPAVVVDCNHANSGKKPFEQARILKEVLHSCRYNPKVKKLVKGFMVESYIEDGNQPVDGGVYGKSITDACIGWKKTEKLIYDMAELL